MDRLSPDVVGLSEVRWPQINDLVSGKYSLINSAAKVRKGGGKVSCGSSGNLVSLLPKYLLRLRGTVSRVVYQMALEDQYDRFKVM